MTAEEYTFCDLSDVEHSCEDCIHGHKDWDDMPCDGCCRAHSGYQKAEGGTGMTECDCDRNVCYANLYNDISCKDCVCMRKDEVAEEIDFIAEHPKADMSKVNTISVNGKEYVSIDRILDILDRYYLWHLNENGNYVTVGEEIKAAVKTLKRG